VYQQQAGAEAAAGNGAPGAGAGAGAPGATGDDVIDAEFTESK
jgi:molecular chaperone DnaK